MEEKVRENRLRRMAERQGMRLEKSRRRDERAVDYGTYHLVDERTNAIVASGLQSGYGLDLDEIEETLTEEFTCGRCNRTASVADDEVGRWMVQNHTPVICPECITPEEHQAMAEASAASFKALENLGDDALPPALLRVVESQPWRTMPGPT